MNQSIHIPLQQQHRSSYGGGHPPAAQNQPFQQPLQQQEQQQKMMPSYIHQQQIPYHQQQNQYQQPSNNSASSSNGVLPSSLEGLGSSASAAAYSSCAFPHPVIVNYQHYTFYPPPMPSGVPLASSSGSADLLYPHSQQSQSHQKASSTTAGNFSTTPITPLTNPYLFDHKTLLDKYPLGLAPSTDSISAKGVSAETSLYNNLYTPYNQHLPVNLNVASSPYFPQTPAEFLFARQQGYFPQSSSSTLLLGNNNNSSFNPPPAPSSSDAYSSATTEPCTDLNGGGGGNNEHPQLPIKSDQRDTCSSGEQSGSDRSESGTPHLKMEHPDNGYNSVNFKASKRALSAEAKEESNQLRQPKTCQWIYQSGMVCNRQFWNLTDLVEHINTDHVNNDSIMAFEQQNSRQPLYVCRWMKCTRQGKVFKAKYKLTNHIRVHTGERPFVCKHVLECSKTRNKRFCGKRFARSENLKERSEEEDFAVNRRHHLAHQSCRHTDAGGTFAGEIAATDFDEEKPFPCKEPGCNRMFANSSDRKKHAETHLKGKMYRCPFCSRHYSHRSSLRKHVRGIHKKMLPKILPHLIVENGALIEEDSGVVSAGSSNAPSVSPASQLPQTRGIQQQSRAFKTEPQQLQQKPSEKQQQPRNLIAINPWSDQNYQHLQQSPYLIPIMRHDGNSMTTTSTHPHLTANNYSNAATGCVSNNFTILR